ncbi:MAG: cytochrome c3 family protein [Nitrospirota bacterium]
MIYQNKIVISLFIVLLIFPFYVSASKSSALSEDAQLCLGCHSDKNLTKELENKETLSLYINGDEFAKTIHGQIGCAGCHTDISMENHPQIKKIASKKAYSVEASQVCTMCHALDEKQKQTFHGYMITRVKKITCPECHGAHYIKKVAEWKKGLGEIRYCLTCHKYEFTMPFLNKELLPLRVDEAVFKASVHADIGCTSCHSDFSMNKHPVRTFKSREEYTAEATRACRICHTDEQLRKNPAHSALVSRDNCVECHGSHDIKRIAAEKAGLKENQYCLTCHSRRLSMTMKSGERLSVLVIEKDLLGSVHANLKCIECHTDFSKAKHPLRTFASVAEYTVVSSVLCNRCHETASSAYQRSIHYSQVKGGNLDAPVCTGCHGSHAVAKATVNRTLGITLCNKCHKDMNSSYEASIHYEAMMMGKENTPTCASCHKAHDVQITTMTTKIKDACFGCHKDMAKIHNKWLWNPPISLPSFAELHFDTVACAACHSPDSNRVVHLMLYDRKTGKPLPEEELLKILETDRDSLMRRIDIDSDGTIDAPELWNFFKLLYSQGVTVTFMGKVDVSKAEEAHKIAGKTKAVKDCEQCHHPDSGFFENVLVLIDRSSAKPGVLTAQPDVLNSAFSIIPISKFYALGSTNIRLLDILFIVAVIGGVAVPIGHITLRIVTSPIRSLRRMKKGGKK